MAGTVTFRVGGKVYHVNKTALGKKSLEKLKKELPHFPESILQQLATPAKKIETQEEAEKPKKAKK